MLEGLNRSLWVALLTCVGCSAGESDETRPEPPPPAEGFCGPDAGDFGSYLSPDQPPLLVGDYAYVSHSGLDEAGVAVLRLGQGTVEKVGFVAALRHVDFFERWQHVHGSLYAHLYLAEHVETLDTTDPLQPVLRTLDLGFTVAGGLGRIGTRVFVCADGYPTPGRHLVSVDLADPLQPLVAPVDSPACSDPNRVGGGHGALWIDGSDVGDDARLLTLYALDQPGAPSLEQTIPFRGLSNVYYGDRVLALQERWDSPPFVLRLDAPNEAPLARTDLRYIRVIAGSVAYSNEIREGGVLSLRGLDLRDPTLPATDAVLKASGATGGYPMEPDLYAHDGTRILGINSKGDVYLLPVGSNAPVEPLTWVDAAGQPLCPTPY